MTQLLHFCFWIHDLASQLLAKHLFLWKKLILIGAHLALFGFFFPDIRKEFGELAGNLLIVILFLSPLSRITRMRLLLQAMTLRRELGIAFGYLATVHGLGYFFDSQWNALFIKPYFESGIPIEPVFLLGILAYFLTLPLLFTSNNLAIKYMGGAKWKLLHRLVYFVFFFAIFHRFLIRGGARADEIAQVVLLLSSYVLLKILEIGRAHV